MGLTGVVAIAVLAASPDDVRQKGCDKMFQALVGDIDDKNFGRSIAGRIQSLNAGLRDLGWEEKNTEAWAKDVPALVKVLRKNRTGFITYCKAEMKQIVAPCDPYGFGTEPYGLCVREKLPAFRCFTDRGPWRFLDSLKAGTLSPDQLNLVAFMISAASARPYCAE